MYSSDNIRSADTGTVIFEASSKLCPTLGAIRAVSKPSLPSTTRSSDSRVHRSTKGCAVIKPSLTGYISSRGKLFRSARPGTLLQRVLPPFGPACADRNSRATNRGPRCWNVCILVRARDLAGAREEPACGSYVLAEGLLVPRWEIGVHATVHPLVARESHPSSWILLTFRTPDGVFRVTARTLGYA